MLTLIGPLSILAGITQGFIMYAVVHTIILVATSAIWISCISHMVELSSKKVPKRRDAERYGDLDKYSTVMNSNSDEAHIYAFIACFVLRVWKVKLTFACYIYRIEISTMALP